MQEYIKKVVVVACVFGTIVHARVEARAKTTFSGFPMNLNHVFNMFNSDRVGELLQIPRYTPLKSLSSGSWMIVL